MMRAQSCQSCLVAAVFLPGCGTLCAPNYRVLNSVLVSALAKLYLHHSKEPAPATPEYTTTGLFHLSVHRKQAKQKKINLSVSRISP